MTLYIKFFILITLVLACGEKDKSSQTFDLAGSVFISSDENLSVTFAEPIIYESLASEIKESGEVEETRIPFLIYYAVDSLKEPYMKASVDYETKQLRIICKPENPHVNWLILRNSDVVNSQTYEYCWQGYYKKKSLSHFINEINKNQFIESERRGNSIDNLGPLREFFHCVFRSFCRPHGDFSNPKLVHEAINLAFNHSDVSAQDLPEPLNLPELYKTTYPLANRVFFESLVVSHAALIHPFHFEKYVPVMHVKSHGHIDFAITGLLDEQMKEKIKRQKARLEQTSQNHNKPNPAKLREVGLATNVQKFSRFLKREMDLLYKDENVRNFTGLKSPIPMPNAGIDENDHFFFDGQTQNQQCGLGTEKPNFNKEPIKLNDSGQVAKQGLGSSDNILQEALGASEEFSLGSQGIFLGNHIGITPLELSYTFTSDEPLQKKHSKYLFVMLEACDTNIGNSKWRSWVELEDKQDSFIQTRALYSAQASLWYRNLDWHNLFHVLGSVPNQKSHAYVMQTMLINMSQRIMNITTKNAEQHLQDYYKVVEQIGIISGNREF